MEEFGFIPFNPSGHWQLEWHIPHHKVLAIKLAMLNDKLAVERKYLAGVAVPKAKDTSQRGDWSCTRNEEFVQVVVETTGKGKKAKSAKVEKSQASAGGRGGGGATVWQRLQRQVDERSEPLRAVPPPPCPVHPSRRTKLDSPARPNPTPPNPTQPTSPQPNPTLFCRK